jgi:hypothetical protein
MKTWAIRGGIVLLVLLVLIVALVAWALLQQQVHHVPTDY